MYSSDMLKKYLLKKIAMTEEEEASEYIKHLEGLHLTPKQLDLQAIRVNSFPGVIEKPKISEEQKKLLAEQYVEAIKSQIRGSTKFSMEQYVHPFIQKKLAQSAMNISPEEVLNEIKAKKLSREIQKKLEFKNKVPEKYWYTNVLGTTGSFNPNRKEDVDADIRKEFIKFRDTGRIHKRKESENRLKELIYSVPEGVGAINPTRFTVAHELGHAKEREINPIKQRMREIIGELGPRVFTYAARSTSDPTMQGMGHGMAVLSGLPKLREEYLASKQGEKGLGGFLPEEKKRARKALLTYGYKTAKPLVDWGAEEGLAHGVGALTMPGFKRKLENI